MRDWLSYWQSRHVDRQEPGPVDHAAGGQFGRLGVAAGDRVWIVTLRNGELFLVGSFEIAEVLDDAAAVERLGAGIYEAETHLIARPGSETDLLDVRVHDIAAQLRFDSPSGRDRLVPVDGRINGQQLQSVRRLTSESAALLHEVVNGIAEASPDDQSSAPSVELLTERLHTGGVIQRGAAPPSFALRSHDELVEGYGNALRDAGHEVRFPKIPVVGEPPIYGDLYDATLDELVEAKSDADSRDDLRNAIGQLLDYSRYFDHEPSSLAVLLPERPLDDRLALLERVGICCIYETQTGVFQRVEPSLPWRPAV